MPQIYPPSTVIENVDQLKEYLQVALKLEHATIPPYLTAAYTAKVEKNKPSIDILTAVAKEEMLHFTLAANLLNAIGGHPELLRTDFVPTYPTPLPTGLDDFDVSIEKFSLKAVRTFLDIERPAPLHPEHAGLVHHIKKTVQVEARHIDKCLLESPHPLVPITKAANGNYDLHYDITVVPHHNLTAKRKAASEARKSSVPHVRGADSDKNEVVLHYYNIGEFYRAISLGFVDLNNKLGQEALFTGEFKNQVTGEHYYSAGGALTVVTDLKTALAAIELIAGQGEGCHGQVYDDEHELAHYYRFDQISKGRYYRVPDENGQNGDEPEKPQGNPFEVDMDAVYPMKTNGKVADYHSSPEVEERALLFNGQYRRFLEKLNVAFNGHPELLGAAFAAEMFNIKKAMDALIRNPIPGTQENAAPTFEMHHYKLPPSASTSTPTPTTPSPAHA